MPYKNPDMRSEASKKWRERNPEWHKLWRKKRSKKIRLECITYYSKGKNCCSCCKENHIEFLAIDHINGGGSKHRKLEVIKYQNIYEFLRSNGFPKGYQILCHNCNLSKGFYGYCPHKGTINQ